MSEIDKEQQFTTLEAALSRLKPFEREVIELRIIARLTLRETALMLNSTPRKIQTLETRALNFLKNSMYLIAKSQQREKHRSHEKLNKTPSAS